MTPSEIKEVVKETLRLLGKLDTQIVQAEAIRRCGSRSRVVKLTKQKHLNPVRDEETGRLWYDVEEFEEVMKRNNVLAKYKIHKKVKSIKNAK